MEELRIRPIRDGTVVDHITRGRALDVLRVLGVDSGTRSVVSVAMNVSSERMDAKDVVKIEGREIGSREADLIALIAPLATVNVVREYDVTEKYSVSMPEEIRGVLVCPNPSCITNTDEPVETRFVVEGDGEVRCGYCDEVISGDVADYVA
ncbi:MAG: aspartate carbamoyltransferase regulatory subunit [Halobacteriales archaeon]